jgi:glyoxylase-like metal-dependent hydrolase (beta-lactamase superfamily II)
MSRLPSVRRVLWIATLAIIAMAGQATAAAAEAPMQKTQAPGYYRMMLGEFEITALFDGIVPLDVSQLKNVTETEAAKLLALALTAGDPHKLPTSANAFLVNTGSKLVLVDTGGGTAFGKGLGQASRNLEAAGYKPEQVDAVLITHLHFDHIGGLLNAEGKAAFPNAVVYLAKAESDYWLSETEPEVPAAFKEHMKQARKLAASAAKPYLATDRWKMIENGRLPIAGIRPVAAPGHTPGHTAYEIRSGEQKLLIIGDMIHIPAVQFARPDAAVSFDSDPKQAVATHHALLHRVDGGTTFVAGMHLPFPGIGRVRNDGKTGYVWIPIEYAPLPAKYGSSQ